MGGLVFICNLQTHIPLYKTGLMHRSSDLFSSFLPDICESKGCSHMHVCVETTGWPRGFPSINLHLIFGDRVSHRAAVQKAPGTCPPLPPSRLSTPATAPCFDMSARDANSAPPPYPANTVAHSATSPPWPPNFLIRSFLI